VFTRGAMSVRVYSPAQITPGEHQVEFPADALWVFWAQVAMADWRGAGSARAKPDRHDFSPPTDTM